MERIGTFRIGRSWTNAYFDADGNLAITVQWDHLDEDGHWRPAARREPEADSLKKLVEALGEFLEKLNQVEARETTHPVG